MVRGEALRVCLRLVVVRAGFVVEVPEALVRVRVVADEALLVHGEALCARLLLVAVRADLAVGVPEALVRLLGVRMLTSPLCARMSLPIASMALAVSWWDCSHFARSLGESASSTSTRKGSRVCCHELTLCRTAGLALLRLTLWTRKHQP